MNKSSKANEFLRKIVEIDSVSGNESELAEFLENELNGMGFETSIDEAGNVIARCGNRNSKDGKRILFCSHMDTVPGKIPVRIENGKLFGRGSVDAKGAIAAFVFGIKNAMEGLDNLDVIVALVVDEERDSKGAKYLLNSINDIDFIVIGEPSSFDSITLGYKGKFSFEYSLTQDSFHSSREEKSAIEHCFDFWGKIREYCNSFNNDKEGIFNLLQARLSSVNSENNGMHENAVMHADFRLPLDFDIGGFTGFLEAAKGGGMIVFGEHVPAYKSGKANELVSSFNAGIKEFGFETKFKLKTGTSDFNLLGSHFKKPIIAYAPGDSNLDHTPNEHIELHELDKAVEVISNSLKKLDRK